MFEKLIQNNIDENRVKTDIKLEIIRHTNWLYKLKSVQDYISIFIP